ncbi:MAG: transporter substrate-binding domain-containing protein [Thermodesulfobacteriota bacterium]
MPVRVVAFAIIFSLTSVLFSPDGGICGPTFDRVTKNGVVRLGLPYNIVPQGYLDPNGQWVGFEVDFGTELAKHMNLQLEKVQITESTWGPLLRSGRIDAAICRIRHTRALESEFDFSVAYFFDTKKVLVPKGTIKGVEDFKGQKVAAVQGTSFEKVAMNLLRASGDESAERNVVSHPDRPSCFLALGKKSVAGWLDSGVILLEYASRNPGKFDLIDASGVAEPIAVAVPQDDSAWRDLINFAIQDMAGDGSLQKVCDKWFGPDSAYSFPCTRAIETWPE